jgi:Zn-dependent protease with chaperone function
MFNNIIYFIIALLIFNISYSAKAPQNSLLFSGTMIALTWVLFAAYCRLSFRKILRRIDGSVLDEGLLTGRYQAQVARLSILAIFLFALDVYLFNLKYWLQLIPGFTFLTALQGISGLSFFFFYLSTIWYCAYPAYADIFRTDMSRGSFILSNVKFNLPILFPWFILSCFYDIIAITPWSGSKVFINRLDGQIIFFTVFLSILMVFMPRFIQYWWGCRPLERSEKERALKDFLHEKRFRYRALLSWPIFEGRMMTAGIMGIVPRYRYILITDSLLEVLSVEELKAVIAHEMGHAKYRHLLFYLLFFVGYMVLSFGLFDLFFFIFAGTPFFTDLLSKGDSQGVNLFYLVLAVPIIFSMFVYFRFVMGFFMRNFERQADLYSASVMGSPQYTVNSLEKIAFFSGKTRNLPSWHHFSIRERVDYLWKTLREPGLFKRHSRFLLVSFVAYLVCLMGLGYFLNFSRTKENLVFDFVEDTIKEELKAQPNSIPLYLNLAMAYQQGGADEKAMEVYEKIIRLDPEQAVALNNLAWLLVTTPEKPLRDKARALELAERAVAVERSPVFLDTLAEAYYVNGQISEAVETIKEALSEAKENHGYYEKQLKKFSGSRQEKG